MCSDVWVAFNWSTQDGQPLTFEFSGEGSAGFVVMYASSNLSYGGYSFYCGAPPRACGDPFLIYTNDTSGQVWNFDWEQIYNYTTTESTAPLL